MVQGIARLAYTVAIGRAWGAVTLGDVGAAMSLSIFLALLWPTPAGNTASRFLAMALVGRHSDDHVRRLLTRTTVTSAGVLALVSVPVGLALGIGVLASAMAGLLVAAYGLYAFARGSQLGYRHARRVMIWDCVASGVSLSLLLVVLLGGLTPLAVLPLSCGYLLFAWSCWPRGNDESGVEDHGAARGAVAFASWNVMAGIATNGLLQLAMIAAQMYGTKHQAGLYAAAFSLATPASMLGQAVSQVVIPGYAHRSPLDRIWNAATLRFTLLFAFLAASALGCVAVVAPFAIRILYGPGYGGSVAMLQLLVVGVFIFTVGLIPAALLLAVGRSREVAIASSTGFFAGVVLALILGPLLGVVAGSLAFVIGSAVSLTALVLVGLRVGPDRSESAQSRRFATDQ